MSFLTWIMFLMLRCYGGNTQADHNHLHDICKSTLRIVWLQSGDTGSIFLHLNESAANLSHHELDAPSCHIQLLGCNGCKLRISVQNLHLPECEVAEVPQFPVCMASCDHLLVYESSYSDITSQFLYLKNNTDFYNRTFESISSSVYIKLCLENGEMKNTNISLDITFQVIDKVELFTGSPYGWHHRGSLQSPAFPHGYALMGEQYIYTLSNTDRTGRIHVQMTDWDLTPNTRLLIFDCTNRSECVPSVHYGYYFRPVVTSLNPTMHLVFEPEYGTLDSRSNTLGFRASFLYLTDNTSVISPVTACGKYFGYRLGGGGHMTFSMSQRLYERRSHDCVWVIRKHSAFDFVLLRVENTSFVYDTWKLEIRASLTSQSTILDTIESGGKIPRLLNDTTSNDRTQSASLGPRTYTSYRGFYIRLTGLLSSRDNFSFTFVSFNKPVYGTCGHSSDHYCPDLSVPQGGACIDRRLVCDGHAHCINASDEGPLCSYQQPTSRPIAAIPFPTCEPNEFRCGRAGYRPGKCIPLHMTCDGWIDCHDGSDEYFCGTTYSYMSTKESECPSEAINCGRECVPLDMVCTHISCQDQLSYWKCPSNITQSREVDLELVFPLCFAAFVVIIAIFAIILRFRQRMKPTRHQVLSPPLRPTRLPSRSRRPRSGIYCGRAGTCLHLSRSTSAASSEPFLANPPSYEESLIGSPTGETVAESCLGSQTTSHNTSPLLEPPPPYSANKRLLDKEGLADVMIA